ncbi:hypothetical protein B0J14DRAFT_656086 [Halenospora varia]|nr:hypothetical protein B0J14DRAFT_656086 [Halenospora varia]
MAKPGSSSSFALEDARQDADAYNMWRAMVENPNLKLYDAFATLLGGGYRTRFKDFITELPLKSTPRLALIGCAAFCGFNYYDSIHGPWNCLGGSTCYYNTDLTGVGCCSSGYCNYATACIPSTEIGTASSRYQGQPWVLTCSNSQLPICVIASFDTSFFSYACANSFFYYSIGLTSPGSGTTPPITGTKRITGGTTPLSPSITPSTSSPSSSASGSTSGNGQTNTGAIVGGVVGGVAGVAFTTLLIWWLITRSRRKKNQIHQENSGHKSMGARSELDAAIINKPRELGGMSATHERTVELPEN